MEEEMDIPYIGDLDRDKLGYADALDSSLERIVKLSQEADGKRIAYREILAERAPLFFSEKGVEPSMFSVSDFKREIRFLIPMGMNKTGGRSVGPDHVNYAAGGEVDLETSEKAFSEFIDYYKTEMKPYHEIWTTLQHRELEFLKAVCKLTTYYPLGDIDTDIKKVDLWWGLDRDVYAGSYFLVFEHLASSKPHVNGNIDSSTSQGQIPQQRGTRIKINSDGMRVADGVSPGVFKDRVAAIDMLGGGRGSVGVKNVFILDNPVKNAYAADAIARFACSGIVREYFLKESV